MKLNEQRVHRKPFARAVLACIFAGPLICGCGERAPYPKPKVTTLVGKSAQCAQCGKTIERVSEQNLVVFDGVQYVVCSKRCAAELQKWLREQ